MPNAIQTKLTDYDGFVDKFVPKKTTDDCYTPQAVYDEVPSASCAYVRRLDNMPGKNGLFGAGFLLSDRATAVKLDAERRAREIKELGGGRFFFRRHRAVGKGEGCCGHHQQAGMSAGCTDR